MNLVQKRRNLIIFLTLCLFIVGVFVFILSNNGFISASDACSHTNTTFHYVSGTDTHSVYCLDCNTIIKTEGCTLKYSNILTYKDKTNHNLPDAYNNKDYCFKFCSKCKNLTESGSYQISYFEEHTFRDMTETEIQNSELTPVEANCMVTGNKLIICSKCGMENFKATPINPDNHIKILDYVLRTATCSEEGLEVYKCLLHPGYSELVKTPVNPDSHTLRWIWTSGKYVGQHYQQCENYATCGFNLIDEMADHDWEDELIQSWKGPYKKCKICGGMWLVSQINGSGGGSGGSGGSGGGSWGGSYDGWGSSDGSSVGSGSTCEHDYSAIGFDDNIHWTKCSKCNETQTNSEATHTFDKAISDGPTASVHSYVCTFEGCTYIKTEAHTFGEDGKCTVPDCSSTNQAQTDCEHDYSVVEYDETNHWKKCSKCNAIEEGSSSSHALGNYENNFDDTHVSKCTFEGCEHSSCEKHEFGKDGTCTICNAKSCDSGEHDYSVTQWSPEKHWLKCTWCDSLNIYSFASHTLSEFTTDSDGNQTAKCTFENCGHSETKIADSLEGDLNEDNLVNITDLIILKRHVIAGSKTEWILTENRLTLADLNNDGDINITDIIVLKRKILESLQS